jgi:hypothetical protein
VELRPHKRAFVRDAAKKPRPVGRHVHIVVKSLIALLCQCRLNNTLFMNRNTGIIMAVTVLAISLEATQENTTDGKDFWAAYSRPEFLILSSMAIE